MSAQPLKAYDLAANGIAHRATGSSIDGLAIRAIHRGGDGYVTLHRKDTEGCEEKWVNIGSVGLPDLSSKFPELSQELARDSYFSINSTYRTARWKVEETGLPYSARERGDFRWLNACYIDLDCYRRGLSDDATLLAVMQMVDRGELPRPSFLVRSGRGVWLLWLLVDEKDRSIPQRAWPEKIEIYERIQRAIVRRLADLGADPVCVDVSRVMRVPESLNSKAPLGSQQVTFLEVESASGNTTAYSLAQMATAFGVRAKRTSAVPTPQGKRHAGPTCTSKHGNMGLLVRWQNALADFETLRQLRGSFRKGCRTHSILLYAYLLTRNGLTGQQVQSAVLKLAAECQPPLEVRKALRTMSNGCQLQWPIRHATLATMLAVTGEERDQLLHWFPPLKVRCSQRVAHRHALIRSLVDEMDMVPSLRTMARLLASKGVTVTARQVGRDYHVLQLQSCHGSRCPTKCEFDLACV